MDNRQKWNLTWALEMCFESNEPLLVSFEQNDSVRENKIFKGTIKEVIDQIKIEEFNGFYNVIAVDERTFVFFTVIGIRI